MGMDRIILAMGLLAGVLLVLGVWRFLFRAFAIRPGSLTVESESLLVRNPADVARINSIFSSFGGGFNAMIARPTWRGWQAYCESQPPRTRPFAEEGAAMGYTLRKLFLYSPKAFERDIVKPRPEFRYLYYVGLGFWSGMRNHAPRKVERMSEGLDPMHRFLCFDGYGFKVAFFDHPKDSQALSRLDSFGGYARNAAYQGVGRAFWFRFHDDPERFVAEASRFGELAVDVAAGAGLASVFVNPDRLEFAQRWASKMPSAWQPHFHLGMCFALKARSINDLDAFEADVERLPKATKDAVWASIRECDRVELLVRSEKRPDGYREWRSRVTQWMGDHIEYPIRAVRSTADRLGEVKR